MSSFTEAYAALDEYRAALQSELPQVHSAAMAYSAASAAAGPALRGAFSAFATPMSNVHATGIGVRLRHGKVVPDDFVLKVYVFDKQDLGARTPAITGKSYRGIGIDIEAMPVQRALAIARKKGAGKAKAGVGPVTTPAQHQARHRPAPGGVQISPAGAAFVGTLGCIVRRGEELFLLSNNHVLADTNRLPVGTPIVQPFGPGPQDMIARLSVFEPIRFPGPMTPNPRNRLDAAIAAVMDRSLVAPGKMFGVAGYVPRLAAARPGRAVLKSGRTTAVTSGTITAIRVNGVMVDYGTPQNPMIATFDGCIEIVGSQGSSFSAPGDSGSVILDRETGEVVALLFAGDRTTTTACDVVAACSRFNVVPA